MAVTQFTAPQRYTRSVSAEENIAVGFDSLPSGVLLTGTPTVAEVGTSDLTLTSAAVNGAALTILGVSYAAGEAVTFHRAGGSANTDYTIRVTVSTDASPADVLVGDVVLRIVA